MHTKYTNVGKTMRHFKIVFDNGELLFRTSLGLELWRILFGKHHIKNSILYHITDLNSWMSSCFLFVWVFCSFVNEGIEDQ